MQNFATNFTTEELDALAQLSKKMELSEMGIMRQALRLYQAQSAPASPPKLSEWHEFLNYRNVAKIESAKGACCQCQNDARVLLNTSEVRAIILEENKSGKYCHKCFGRAIHGFLLCGVEIEWVGAVLC